MVDRATATDTTQLFLSETPRLIFPRVQVKRAGALLNLMESQAIPATNSKETLNVYPATMVPSTFLQGSSTLAIPVQPSAVFLKHLRIEFTLTNTGVNPVAVLPVPLWFASANIAGNNGNLVLQQWTSPASLQLAQINNIPDEQLIAIAPALNINAADPTAQATTAVIAAGATVKFYMNFADAFYEQVPLWMGDLKGNLILTLNSSPNTAFDVTTGAGTIASITLVNCRALATVVQPSPEQVSYMNNQTIRDNQFLAQTVTSVQQPLGASTQYSIRMGGNQGLCPWIIVTTRGPIPFATPAGARNWPDVTKTISILDSTGNPIVQTVDEHFLSTFMAADYWQGCQIFQQIGGVMQWSFASSPAYIQHAGIIMGGYYFTSNEQYQFTTEASTTAGTYEINIICPVYSILRIKDGTFSVYNS